MGAADPLLQSIGAPGYADRVSAAAERIGGATDAATAQQRLMEAITVLGVPNAFFASFVRHGDELACWRRL